jgi:hypothetical protein
VARSRNWCHFSNAAAPLLRSTMFLAGPLDFQLRLDHAPQQADEMCHDLAVAASSNVWFDLDQHLIRQATKRHLKRGNAFGFVSHKGLLLISVPPTVGLVGDSLQPHSHAGERS